MFKLPQSVVDGVESYRDSLKDYQESAISPNRFKGIRVPWGIYSHRGGESYMMRIRLPAGVMSPKQLGSLADAARRFGDGFLHLTTRQDIQLHGVSSEDTIRVIDFLKDNDLSPRGGGGNTVRNITACPLAGVCPDEVFDVRKYAVGLTEFMLQNETSFTLPRKFKISFSGCDKDCAGGIVNDVGFFATRKNGEDGFSVSAAGGLGATSILGKPLESFISRDHVPYVVSAVKNVFFRRGDRKNKHRNRLRFLVQSIGFDAFKNEYKDELKTLKQADDLTLREVEFASHNDHKASIPENKSPDLDNFLQYNVRAQKQNGFVSVELRIPRGDISSEQASALSELGEVFPGVEFRTTQNQNLAIVWVDASSVGSLYERLLLILDDFVFPNTLMDVQCCKGAVTCNLGLCNSPGLTSEIEKMVRREFIGKKVFSNLDVKISGCPNSCGRHPIGRIALHGMVKRVNKRSIPLYKLLIGGGTAGPNPRLAETVGSVPARNVPGFLKAFLRRLEPMISNEADIDEVLKHSAKHAAKELLPKYAKVPQIDTDRSFYIDWGQTEIFSLDGLTTGECGAGVLDMIESDLADAQSALDEASQNRWASDLVSKSIFLTARSLLIVRGCDPKSEAETFIDFDREFLKTGIAAGRFADSFSVFEALTNKSSQQHAEKAPVAFEYAGDFLEHIREVYGNMDSAFNFPSAKPVQNSSTTIEELDLIGTQCPLNYVKTKIAIEELESGQFIEVLLDDGDPIKNVPRSLELDGHEIVALQKENQHFRLKVRKGVAQKVR